ncbi:MAG: hypothetical protein ACRDN0_27395, partial [Trebonia sp.]
LMLADAAATVEAPAGMEPDGYAAEVIRRFRNAALRHRCAQIAMDGSQKLPQRLLGTVRDRLDAGATPVWAGLAVAAWMRHVWTERTDGGRPFAVDDPMAGLFRERLAAAGVSPGDASVVQARAVAEGLLGIRAIFGDLADSEEFRALVTDHLRRLARDGALRTVAALVS